MVYFVQGIITKAIKIGHTDRPLQTRLNMMQSSDPLICLKVIEGANDETRYQNRFKQSWSHGEWFLPSDNLIEFINALPASRYDGLLQQVLGPWNRHSTNKGKAVSPETVKKISESQRRRHAFRSSAGSQGS